MILAEKITEARKKNGWSQEEMAEKLSVSRQAVSKWESAQSTPDLQKVLRLAEIFGVSTDYLLKDELKSETGTEILEYAAEESSVRSVSMEEANAFMEWRRKTGPTLAGAVAPCIISPALLIFLAGLSDSHIENISENMATGAGISVLLLLVAAAVVIFVSYSIHGQQYEYLEKERIETAYGVTGLVQERKKDYESTFTRGIAAGVTLCILAVIPMFAAIAFSQPDYIITATVSILLLLVAVGVFFIVRVSTINGSYVILLQEGEYTPEEKRYKKKTEVFTTAYWCIVTAIYLVWSFQTREWDKTWILWAVAGVLFGGVRAVMRGRIKHNTFGRKEGIEYEICLQKRKNPKRNERYAGSDRSDHSDGRRKNRSDCPGRNQTFRLYGDRSAGKIHHARTDQHACPSRRQWKTAEEAARQRKTRQNPDEQQNFPRDRLPHGSRLRKR